jgi:helix-turn-helix protein
MTAIKEKYRVELNRRDVLTSEHLSDELGAATETLRAWRAAGKGPKWFRLPGTRRVLYAREDVDAFLAAARAGDVAC